jgi:hypothetical protein
MGLACGKGAVDCLGGMELGKVWRNKVVGVPGGDWLPVPEANNCPLSDHWIVGLLRE